MFMHYHVANQILVRDNDSCCVYISVVDLIFSYAEIIAETPNSFESDLFPDFEGVGTTFAFAF